MPSLLDSFAKNIFNKATVTYKQQIAPHAYRITVQSDALKGHPFIAGEHLRLFVGIDRDTALDSKVRTYSIWEHDSNKGTADMAMCLHSSGIGARWIEQVKVGEDIYYMGPKGKLVIDKDADSHLMISDPSALSHMYAIRNQLGASKTISGYIYAEAESDHYADIDGSHPFQFMQLRYDATDAIIREVSTMKGKLPGIMAIYIAGDARICKSLSRFFRQNWPDARVYSKGFWMPGKTGMD